MVTLPSSSRMIMGFMIPHVQAPASRKLNTLIWVHGGSLVEGSATGAGMDRAHIALASRSVVVTVQYRLGLPFPIASPHSRF
ncbi:hypothetical protein BS47DRAFT_1397450 [Hydnum rufescens UP504]|uniref:Carboxylesterase type B domain-containing protein n=1 Tax=Hydnum rufescens UP504 TaxID=1448309 RepID=A0A9P6AP30_9AGAM|nr:hypothetical protein BS47DRAFT_1397450 [Hydnum rufescens UP504]